MRTLKNKRDLLIAASFVVALAALTIGERALEQSAAAQAKGQVMAPRYEVDPMFPKPLPNHWYMGMTIGVAVDAQDHVWIVHRPDTVTGRGELAADEKTGDCCAKAPPILEFDQQGNLLRHWGGQDGPGYTWPLSNHGIWIDHKGNVWIGGNGGTGNSRDGQILKFTQDGKFLAQYGKGGVPIDSNSKEHFGQVAKIFVDPRANEAYIADGYGNRRVAVIDADTGEIKRFWGAYGEKPDDTPTPRYDPKAPLIRQFRTPVHCADLSVDGLVYVCDRPNDRLQIFKADGTFVKEVRVAPDTMGDGSTWDVAFSRDPAQKYMFLADGKNEKIYVIDRQSMEILTSFGDGGRQPGQFYAVHSIAIDSKGNLFTTETYEGRRLQKFVYKGLAPVTAKDQGTVWPKTSR
jgi:DNA-binding beta-propeller fold protein YncE